MQKELFDITEYLHKTGEAIKVYMNIEFLKKEISSISLLKNPDNADEAYKLIFQHKEDAFLLFKYDKKTLNFLQKHFKFTKEIEK